MVFKMPKILMIGGINLMQDEDKGDGAGDTASEAFISQCLLFSSKTSCNDNTYICIKVSL